MRNEDIHGLVESASFNVRSGRDLFESATVDSADRMLANSAIPASTQNRLVRGAQRSLALSDSITQRTMHLVNVCGAILLRKDPTL